MTAERWKPVHGHHGWYEVSDQGAVRSLDRVKPDSRGRLVRYKGKMLRPGLASNGYLTVSLCGVSFCIHDLVLTAFRGERPSRAEALHRNGIRTDNALTNMRWGTCSQNGLDKKWYSQPKNHKLNVEKAREIKARLAKGVPVSTLSDEFGVSGRNIRYIRQGHYYGDV